MTNVLEITLPEAYQVGLDRTKDENAARRWNFYVKHFLKLESESEEYSGKWKVAHMFLTRLGVDHDNCSFCNTANER